MKQRSHILKLILLNFIINYVNLTSMKYIYKHPKHDHILESMKSFYPFLNIRLLCIIFNHMYTKFYILV